MLIIFDLDDTLIDTSGSYLPFKLRLALKAMIKNGLKVDSEEKSFEKILEINIYAGNGKNAIKQFLEEVGWDENIFKIGVNTYYGETNELVCIEPLPHTLSVLEELSKENILALVSYGDEKEQHHKLRATKIKEEWFKKIIITNEYDKTLHYEYLLEKFHVAPKDTIAIGDKFEGDLLPARKLGMKTIHFMYGRGKTNPPSLESVDYQTDNILKVKEIVKELK
jgi:putative hydrolase of the HAD superfamily